MQRYQDIQDVVEQEFTFTTERKQVMQFIEYDGVARTGTVEKSGDDYWLFRNKV